MARSGRKLEDKDLESLINDFDLSKDQKISWEEFYRIMNMNDDEDI